MVYQLNLFEFSSFFGRDTYFGFAVDWFLETISIISCFVCFVPVGSLYTGLCLYINGMVLDMKARLTYTAFGSQHRMDLWSVYVKEIAFHIEIIQ